MLKTLWIDCCMFVTVKLSTYKQFFSCFICASLRKACYWPGRPIKMGTYRSACWPLSAFVLINIRRDDVNELVDEYWEMEFH